MDLLLPPSMSFGVMRRGTDPGTHWLSSQPSPLRLADNLNDDRVVSGKVPHVVLFGLFFLFTAVQFDRVDRRTLAWSLAGALALGALVELEEGATRTGNCRPANVLPDARGALIAMVLLIGLVMIRDRLRAREEGSER
jgi:hypothetical protein